MCIRNRSWRSERFAGTKICQFAEIFRLCDYLSDRGSCERSVRANFARCMAYDPSLKFIPDKINFKRETAIFSPSFRRFFCMQNISNQTCTSEFIHSLSWLRAFPAPRSSSATFFAEIRRHAESAKFSSFGFDFVAFPSFN